MFERAFIGVLSQTVNLMDHGIDAYLIAVEHLPNIAAQNCNLMVVEIDDVARISQEGRSVAGQKLFALPDADDERTTQARSDEHIRMAAADDCEAIRPF